MPMQLHACKQLCLLPAPRLPACTLASSSCRSHARLTSRRAGVAVRMVRHRAPKDLRLVSISAGPSQSAAGKASEWQLVPLVSSEVTQAFEVPSTEVLIGSSSKADFEVPSADAEHAKLRVTADGLFITNLRSAQGILVEGKELKPGDSTVLKDNARVVIGEVSFLARSLDASGQASAGRIIPSQENEGLLESSQQSQAGGSAVQQVKQDAPKGLAYEYGHWLLSLGLLYFANKSLAKATAAAGIAFPSPLIGMFGIIAVLFVVSRASVDAAERLSAFFSPALNWIQRWLPVFYVPTLITVPLAIDGIGGGALLRILLVILVGMPASLIVTAAVAKKIREATNTELEPPEPLPPSQPFSRWHHIGWAVAAALWDVTGLVPGGLAAGSFLAAAFGPAEWARRLVVPFMLAATVEGLLLGEAIPKEAAKFVHPLITCAVVANLGAAAFAAANGWAYKHALELYITKGTGAPLGGGDYLMSFLGVVILSFGFRIFGQRRLMVRHAPEIFGSTIFSSAFSLFGTAAFARTLGLAPVIARALAPRSVTVALALPIATQLNAPQSIAAAGVALTGLLGSNSVQLLLNKLGYKDPIARGLATAGASHGLGTAALAGKEPEALPFCALAYALIGIISTVLVSIPVVQSALIATAG